MAFYNKHAAKGEDPVFHKGENYLTPIVKAPFGAIDPSTENLVYSAFTLGGLRTDVDGCVLSATGEAIVGLYAAGRTTSGMSLGDGSFFGRRAGRGAANGER